MHTNIQRRAAKSTDLLRHVCVRGLTLIEMLVAMTVTLMLVYALVQLFSWVGDVGTKGRAMLEMSGQLRSITILLQRDLDGRTAPPLPWTETPAGYFEYVEGSGGDTTGGAAGIKGDLNDVLAFTSSRNDNDTFTGRKSDGTVIYSNRAEVVWWITTDTTTSKSNLYRRTLLIRPDLNDSSGKIAGGSSVAALQTFQATNDISVRLGLDNTGSTAIIANSLEDTTRRENRYAHAKRVSGAETLEFPYPLDPANLTARIFTGARLGSDVVYSDVYAFDVRAYDVLAPAYSKPDQVFAIAPSDLAYAIDGTPSGTNPSDFDPIKFDSNGTAPPGATYAETGAGWSTGTPGSAHSANSRLNTSAGGTATWTFTGLLGTVEYDVWITWPGSNAARHNAVPCSVLNGSTSVYSTTLNQRDTSPVADVTDGVAFQKLGRFTFSTGTLKVTLTSLGPTGQTMVDAIRIARVPPSPEVPHHGNFVDLAYAHPNAFNSSGGTAAATYTKTIIENGAGYVEAGTGWITGTPATALSASARFSTTANDTATWTFSGLASDSYEVWITWPAAAARHAAIPCLVLDGVATETTVTLNQQNTPIADVTDGVAFQKLGLFSISNGSISVRLTSPGGGQTFADAVRIKRVDTPATAGFSEPKSFFGALPNAKSQLTTLPTWDTWPASYENDGINQDGDALTDEGTNGIDDPETPGDNNTIVKGVDDADERETAPPYSVPLRGIEVRIRAFEPDTRQIRQASVVSYFAPE